ncbi:30S ribosomal protein S19e [Candidatus Micrarchaeota archaeon]|nr:30S ribosomal protein S19e [Candidatus Micrarchaeota archaeon]MBU1165723.1 30S ribosomal protein S19e [Candidatus Micrarchaeota archaeon]MBU1887090.1 30S ribosomal protein S19e [Candidatus Micrarchaeota archaeon]
MVTIYDVDPNKLIAKVAEKLKSMKISKPDFVGMVKTGAHASRPPHDPDFWYSRCASILRHIYVHDVVGTQRLRRHYGGRKRRGVRPEHHAPAGGSTIRKAMQELEKSGLLLKEQAGRRISPKGRQLLDNAAKECM